MLLGILLMLIGALLTLSIPLGVKIVGLVMFTFGFFGSHSVASGWVGMLANKKEKAQASSLYLLFYYAGSSVVGALGGIFLHKYGWSGEVTMLMVLLLAGLVSVRLIKVDKSPTINSVKNAV
ncbi:MAG: MFS transporter [Bacillaceae bacterium]